MEQNISTLPQYEALTTALGRVNSQLTAAECHGLIAGALNTQNTALISRFFTEDDELVKGDAEFAELISQLVHLTAEGYRDEDFNFQLLLPDDDVPCRTGAGHWRNGAAGILWVCSNLASKSLTPCRKMPQK